MKTKQFLLAEWFSLLSYSKLLELLQRRCVDEEKLALILELQNQYAAGNLERKQTYTHFQIME